jgi:hypothetical protein
MSTFSVFTGDAFRTLRLERRVVEGVAALTSLSDETLIDSSSRFETRVNLSGCFFLIGAVSSLVPSETSFSASTALAVAAVGVIKRSILRQRRSAQCYKAFYVRKFTNVRKGASLG